MSLTLMVYSFVAIFYLTMGLLTFHNDRKAKSNQMFLAISVTLSFWSFSLAFMTAANDPVIAAGYRRLMVLFWSALYAEILAFVLLITERNRILKKVWFKILICIPAIACFIIYFFNPIPAEYMVRITGTWAYSFPNDWGFLYDNFLSIYYASYMIASILLLIIYSRKSKYTRTKKQARLIYISFIVVTVLASITDIILPSLGYSRIPPLTTLLSLISVVCVWYAIGKYSMMNLSSEKIQIYASKIMNEGLIIIDNKNQVVQVNNGAQKMLECEGMKCPNLMKSGKVFPKEILDMDVTNSGYECCVRTLSGREVPVIVSKNIIVDSFGEKYGTTLYFQDITQIKNMHNALQKEKDKLEIEVSKRTQSLKKSNNLLQQEVELRIVREREIEEMAYRDHLTGLPNRRMFNEQLKREIKRAERTDVPFALLFIDLDGFKLINDSLGHSCGDMLLKQVSHRLVKTLRVSDLVTRLGGDEFAILVFNPADYNAIETICKKILREIESPYKMHDSEVRISASIGVSVCPNDSCDPIQLLKNADISMYEAKKCGAGKYAFFDSNKCTELEEAMTLTNDLYHALENNELEVYYQPQISVETKKVIGFEALVRWNHPKHGFLLPEQFINIAERTELIYPIGKWVFETACRQLKLWNEMLHKDMKMAINLSPRQLENSDFENAIINAVEKIGIDPNLIELEITEGVLVKDIKHTIKTLSRLREVGIHIAIDDFGTEYSSFSYVKHFAVNQIKIPKPFIDGINENRRDESIVISTIQLAKNLGIDVVAEGVEQDHQYQYLLKHKCDIIQGFLFYEPMSVLEIEKELDNSEKYEEIAL